ncbi:hypothetical protein G5V59_14580 [Nocardioides sp. W3-2-3]|nr:hypothetical protein [Nocardioides convexus]
MSLTDFRPFLRTASTFWRHNVLPESERIILVEAMSQDLRVTLRNLTVANALRRMEPARVIVYSGADEDWNQIVWTYFNLEEISQMATAYGAETVFDVHALVDARVAGTAEPLEVAGVDLGGDLPESGISPQSFEDIVYATACRMALVARLDDSPELQAKKAHVAARSVEFAKIYDALLANNDVVALITSHVDYNNFGLGVEAALRHDVPVLFPQSTGGLKVYGLFPEKPAGGRPDPGRADLAGSASSSTSTCGRTASLLHRGSEPDPVALQGHPRASVVVARRPGLLQHRVRRPRPTAPRSGCPPGAGSAWTPRSRRSRCSTTPSPTRSAPTGRSSPTSATGSSGRPRGPPSTTRSTGCSSTTPTSTCTTPPASSTASRPATPTSRT